MIDCADCENYKDCCNCPSDFDLCISNDWDRYKKEQKIMNIPKVKEAYGSTQLYKSKAMTAYQASAEPRCKICAELSANQIAIMTGITTEDGFISFYTNITYCPACGRRITYGKYDK